MDLTADTKAFDELMTGLALTLTGFPAKPELIQAYWIALKDVRLSEVRGTIERILRTATKATAFPKPVELRNTPPAANSEHLQDLEQRSRRNWDERLRAQPIEGRVELYLARACRMTSITPLDDPARARWDAECQYWSGLRYAPVEMQQAAISARLPGGHLV